MIAVHVTSSTSYGSVERQILGLARRLPDGCRSAVLSFREGGRCRAFLDAAQKLGYLARALEHDTPRLLGAMAELTQFLRQVRADVVCTHGYKADVVGLAAARRAGIPIVAVSHGWTRESLRVRCYEALDRVVLRKMDRVVCVSQSQATKVRRAGVAPGRIIVIRCAVEAERLEAPEPVYREKLRGWFSESPGRVIGAAGRLSPEKGFAQLVEAAALATRADSSLRFILFGSGRLQRDLERRIAERGLQQQFVLAGFRTDFDRFLPHLDLLVLPSYTEGLPNVVLEAFAAGVPVVATAVGGTPEAVEDGVNGYLVPPGDPPALAQRIRDALSDEPRRQAMARRGRHRVLNEFSFENLSASYLQLFEELTPSSSSPSDLGAMITP
jgi:glycosyltransferase involved in cell wall biosynthesis